MTTSGSSRSPEAVLEARAQLKIDLAQLNIKANDKKERWFWGHDEALPETVIDHLNRNDIKLETRAMPAMGGAIGTSSEGIQEIIDKIAQEHHVFWERLLHPAMPSQEATILARASGTGRMTHAARCCRPAETKTGMEIFDRDIINTIITKCDLPALDDRQQQLMQLPGKTRRPRLPLCSCVSRVRLVRCAGSSGRVAGQAHARRRRGHAITSSHGHSQRALQHPKDSQEGPNCARSSPARRRAHPSILHQARRACRQAAARARLALSRVHSRQARRFRHARGPRSHQRFLS